MYFRLCPLNRAFVLLETEAIVPTTLLSPDATAAEAASDDECDESDAARDYCEGEPRSIVGLLDGLKYLLVCATAFPMVVLRVFVVQILECKIRTWTPYRGMIPAPVTIHELGFILGH